MLETGTVRLRYAASVDSELLRTAAEALSDDDRGRFLDLCEAREPETLRADASRIRAHLNVIELMAAEDPLVDVMLARHVVATLLELIVVVGELSFEQRRLLAGAIEYFLQVGGRR